MNEFHDEATSSGSELVSIEVFRDLPRALLAKGKLESMGIESYLVDDNTVRMDWFISNLLGGVKLCVRLDNAEEASRILEEPTPGLIEMQDLAIFEQPRCPRCESLEISNEALNRKVAYLSAWLGFPVPLKRNRWKCDSCGCHWKFAPNGGIQQ